jgi:hypothetical protein
MKAFRWHLALALLAGFALRLFFLLQVPASSGDTPLYEELATNWLRHGTYGVEIEGQLTPVDVRMPGYPAFLAMVYAVTGYTGEAARPWVMLAQTILDLGTCLLAAVLAARLAPDGQRARIAAAALWLTATCAFLANYVAVPLTEVWATFFTTATLWILVVAFRRLQDSVQGPARAGTRLWLLGGLAIGMATLFRPESSLLAVAAALTLLFLWRRLRAGAIVRIALLGVAILVPLAPWAARNWAAFHELQPLAPEYAQLSSELVPYGFMAWEKTWLVRFRDVYLVSWRLNEEPIPIEDVSPAAFDSPAERARVAAILAQYNKTVSLTQPEDDAFAQIARERTARHPLRTYLWVPLGRVVTLWFTPRIELLPFSGNVFPLAEKWDEDRADQALTVSFFFLNTVYVLFVLLGLWHLLRASPQHRRTVGAAVAFLLVYILVRTAFLTTLETPEQRYVIECYPALLALAAHAFLKIEQQGSALR